MRFDVLVFAALVSACGGDDAPADGGDTGVGMDTGLGGDTGGSDASSDAPPSDVGGSDVGPIPDAAVASVGSLSFFDRPGDDDYAQLLDLPDSFGEGELTLELWIRPSDRGGLDWFGGDPMPYSADRWWANGNWFLDGHNNARVPEAMRAGTFDLMFYGGGRVRWLVNDGDDLWAVQAYPADTVPALNDGAWHHVAVVRRFASDVALELWVDGAMVGEERVTGRADLREFWRDWPGPQPGWFFGAEKMSATGSGGYRYDYEGEISELRFWSAARPASALGAGYRDVIDGSEPGLVGWYLFGEGTGDRTCNALAPGECMTLVSRGFETWSAERPPLR